MLSPYRKKPVVVQAIRVPAKLEDFQEFLNSANNKQYAEGKQRIIKAAAATVFGPSGEEGSVVKGVVSTLEGTMEFTTGDWIIEGVAGELYPCRDDIFRATYEEAGEGDQS